MGDVWQMIITGEWLFNPLALAVLALVVIWLVAGISIARRIISKSRTRARDEAAKNEYSRWFDETARLGTLPRVDVSVSLGADETCYLARRATLCEPRAVRTSVHAGGAVRVARGVTVGAGHTTSESHDEWREISSGILYVTDRRIIFDGDMINRVIDLRKLLSVEASTRRLTVSCASRQNTMVFVGLNALIARAVIGMIARV